MEPIALKSYFVAIVTVVILCASQTVFAENSALSQIQVTPPLSAALDSLRDQFPATSIQSSERAALALAEVQKLRSRIEIRYLEDERACHPKFFTTDCLNEARENRRQARAQIRSIELEADAFKRNLRVVERDKALAEKRAQELIDAPRRLRELQDREHAASQNFSARMQSAQTSGGNVDAFAKAKTSHTILESGKSKRTTEQNAVDIKLRADNIKAYQRKVREAEKRQREIADKKYEKELERRQHEASSADQ